MSSYQSHDLLRLLQAEVSTLLSYTAVLARQCGLSISEIAALEYLMQSGELTPRQLGARLAMTSGSVTALVDRLERIDYVQRIPHPTDRRSLLIRPTGPGIESVRQKQEALASEMLALHERLSAQERVAVGQYMQALNSIITRHAQHFSEKETE